MSFLAWLADVFLGPRCPFCPYRGRGERSLRKHAATHGEVCC